MREQKYPKVKRICDITVYPKFCKMDWDMVYLLEGATGLCEDDDGSIAFLDEEAKSKCLKRIYNIKNRRKISEEEYKRRQKEIQKRRCLK